MKAPHIRVRILTATGLALGLSACAIGPTPTAHTPTDTTVTDLLLTGPSTTSDAPTSLNRAKVKGDGEPSNPDCTVERPCRLIGSVDVTSAGGTLAGTYSPLATFGAQALTTIYDFSAFAQLSGTGRFEGIAPGAAIRVDVSRDVATMTIRLPAPKDGWYLVTERTKPTLHVV